MSRQIRFFPSVRQMNILYYYYDIKLYKAQKRQMKRMKKKNYYSTKKNKAIVSAATF